MNLYVLLYFLIYPVANGLITTSMPKNNNSRLLYSNSAKLINFMNKFQHEEPIYKRNNGGNDHTDDLMTRLLEILQKKYDSNRVFVDLPTVRVHYLSNPEELHKFRTGRKDKLFQLKEYLRRNDDNTLLGLKHFDDDNNNGEKDTQFDRREERDNNYQREKEYYKDSEQRERNLHRNFNRYDLTTLRTRYGNFEEQEGSFEDLPKYSFRNRVNDDEIVGTNLRKEDDNSFFDANKRMNFNDYNTKRKQGDSNENDRVENFSRKNKRVIRIDNNNFNRHNKGRINDFNDNKRFVKMERFDDSKENRNQKQENFGKYSDEKDGWNKKQGSEIKRNNRWFKSNENHQASRLDKGYGDKQSRELNLKDDWNKDSSKKRSTTDFDNDKKNRWKDDIILDHNSKNDRFDDIGNWKNNDKKKKNNWEDDDQTFNRKKKNDKFDDSDNGKSREKTTKIKKKQNDDRYENDDDVKPKKPDDNKPNNDWAKVGVRNWNEPKSTKKTNTNEEKKASFAHQSFDKLIANERKRERFVERDAYKEYPKPQHDWKAPARQAMGMTHIPFSGKKIIYDD